ncbi:hypothetical protein PV797_10315 [Clostridiaceae bacterium M8S5]|nr:hypothetical protein PV797_10315 [Clostridiaceae bacterium M8S5]
MKARIKYKSFVAIILLIFAILLLSSCESKKVNTKTKVNEDIIKIKDFTVSTDSTSLNTNVKGTIFVKGKEGIPKHIRIVANVEVDENDWGGVVLYIPKKWDISNVSSSFLSKGSNNPKENISTFETKSEKYDWYKFIEVGANHSHSATGGTGTIIVDLIPVDIKIQQFEKCNIVISVGSDEKNGVKINGTDSITIEVP